MSAKSRILGSAPARTLVSMGFVVTGHPGTGALAGLVGELPRALRAAGFDPASDALEPSRVLSVDEDGAPRPFRRRSRGTFVAALHGLDAAPADPLREGYPVLVRALANVSLTYVPGDGEWFTTLERGSYLVPATDGHAALAAALVARLTPLARSR